MSEKQSAQAQALANILNANDADADAYIEEKTEENAAEGWDEEDGVVAKEGYCVECEGLSRSLV